MEAKDLVRGAIASLLGLTPVGCGSDDGDSGLDQQTSGIAGPGDTGGSESSDDGEEPEPDDGDDAGTGVVPDNNEVCDNGIDDDGDGTIDEQCACVAGQTQPCFPEGADDACPGTQTCSGVGEIVSWGACEVDVQACEPEETTGGEPVDPCEADELLTATQVLTFESPLATLGPCPWGQADNLGHTSGVMAARHEVSQLLEPPAGAVICSTEFEVPETSMYYDDQLYMLFNDVVILAPGDWSGLLPAEDDLLIYDWLLIRGFNGNHPMGEVGGGSGVYCPGANSVCELPDTQQNGSIDLELDAPTQQAVLERAALQGHYTVTVAATGDDNPSVDCDHSTFDLVVTYTYGVP